MPAVCAVSSSFIRGLFAHVKLLYSYYKTQTFNPPAPQQCQQTANGNNMVVCLDLTGENCREHCRLAHFELLSVFHTHRSDRFLARGQVRTCWAGIVACSRCALIAACLCCRRPTVLPPAGTGWKAVVTPPYSDDYVFLIALDGRLVLWVPNPPAYSYLALNMPDLNNVVLCLRLFAGFSPDSRRSRRQPAASSCACRSRCRSTSLWRAPCCKTRPFIAVSPNAGSAQLRWSFAYSSCCNAGGDPQFGPEWRSVNTAIYPGVGWNQTTVRPARSHLTPTGSFCCQVSCGLRNDHTLHCPALILYDPVSERCESNRVHQLLRFTVCCI